MSFGTSASKPFSFGSLGQSNVQPQATPFGGLNQPQQNNPFSFPKSQQNSNPFGLSTQPQQQQQQTGFGFGGSTNQQGSAFGQSQQQQQQQQQQPFGETLQYGQQLRLGQSQNTQAPFWQEGRGQPVYRSIPAQLKSVRDKWNPNDLSSPFRTYL